LNQKYGMLESINNHVQQRNIIVDKLASDTIEFKSGIEEEFNNIIKILQTIQNIVAGTTITDPAQQSLAYIAQKDFGEQKR